MASRLEPRSCAARKAEIDRFELATSRLYERKQPIRDAVEMAQLAMRLGRQFEARGFLTVAISDDPNRQDLRRDLERLSQSREAVAERRQTCRQVADVLERFLSVCLLYSADG